jgi:hypothetical protein
MAFSEKATVRGAANSNSNCNPKESIFGISVSRPSVVSHYRAECTIDLRGLPPAQRPDAAMDDDDMMTRSDPIGRGSRNSNGEA